MNRYLSKLDAGAADIKHTHLQLATLNIARLHYYTISERGERHLSNLLCEYKIEELVGNTIAALLSIGRWPSSILKCPKSDWVGILPVIGKVCKRFLKPAHHFNNEHLCFGLYCLTDLAFTAGREASMTHRCIVCYTVTGHLENLACGSESCMAYLLRICRIRSACGKGISWIDVNANNFTEHGF